MGQELLLDQFNFELAEELIAKYPCDKRDESRMLVYNKSKDKLEHKNFTDILEYFSAGDILVRNQSKVLPARFYIKNKFGTDIEVLLIKNIQGQVWKMMAKPAKRLKQERTKYFLEEGARKVEIYRKDDEIFIDFLSEENFNYIIGNLSQMPIPPYFKRSAEDLDKERYQTVYAQEDEAGFSIAAPTAGLHFTPKIIKELEDKGVEILDLTLHVGLGTFLPVKTNNIKEHKMHAEYYSVEPEVWQKITDAKKFGKKIFAVGSTSVRTLETIAKRKELNGETDIFIYPGFEFEIVDAMLTNFHLPKSTLIMMIAAFLDRDTVMNIYKEAVENKYRFFSYGDCCLFI